MNDKKAKLGLWALVAMCVGSMIGSGLFDLPQNVAATTGVVALFIAWSITFLGMVCLAKVFQNLSDDYPKLDTGVYAYAKAGLGDYLGFSSAWGYWLSAWIGNVGYMNILSLSLVLLFPELVENYNLFPLIFSSAVVWGMTYLCIRGVKSASFVNMIATVTKIIPIVILIIVMIAGFNYRIFTFDVWQIDDLGSVMSQVKNMMLVTVWVFIGIEGANVFSSRARSRKDVGRATVISFMTVFLVLFAVSVLPFGIMSQAELAALKEPSTSGVMYAIVGDWGRILMGVSLVVSVLGALLSWILIAAEVPFVAGTKDELFPKPFTTTNKFDAPQGALIITGVCQQLYLIIAHYYASGYLATIKLSTSMILLPYLFSAFYALKVSLGRNGNGYRCRGKIAVGLLATIYGIWLLYAAGIKYLLLSSILYAVGSAVYIVNKRSRNRQIFINYEKLLFITFIILGVICLVALVNGSISLS